MVTMMYVEDMLKSQAEHLKQEKKHKESFLRQLESDVRDTKIDIIKYEEKMADIYKALETLARGE
jgi:hypothetical protein